MKLPKQPSIPLVDISAQQEEVQEHLNSQLKDIFRLAAFIGGREVDLFEAQYAELKRLGLASRSFPVSEAAAAAGEILSIPIYPHITGEQQQHVAQTLRNAVAGGLK